MVKKEDVCEEGGGMSVYGLIGKCGSVLKYAALVAVLVFALGGGGAVAAASQNDSSGAVAEQVICNVIRFVQKLGLPIMTGVILGSSIMAIFGKVSWPAIVMLVVFTGIFFGAGKIMQKFAHGLTGVTAHKTSGGGSVDSWTCVSDA